MPSLNTVRGKVAFSKSFFLQKSSFFNTEERVARNATAISDTVYLNGLPICEVADTSLAVIR